VPRVPSSAVRAALAAVFALSLLPAASGSEPPAECPTWFPDLRGCGRSGRFDGFEKPIVQPYQFEDPFIVTGFYPYYLYHEFPDRSALQGGELHLAAAQIRVAITDRLGFLAGKDGFGWMRPDNPLLDDREGWFNLVAALKYAFAQDREAGWIVSGILRFEVPTGASDMFQGHGDGAVLPSIAGAWTLGRAHLIADFGAQVPFDTSQQSTSLFYHLYGDVAVAPHFQPFVQLSGLTWIDSGDGSMPVRLASGAELPLDVVQSALGTGAFEGADVANLGSRGVRGLDLWTIAAGVHVPINRHVTLSAAYERPFSHHKGIFQDRVTTSVRIEF
jgi:hypothetical protein